MEFSDTRLRTGDRVRLRKQRWRVVQVHGHERCELLTLAGIGPQNAGTTQSFIRPFDSVEPLERAGRLRLVTRRQWRRQCRTLIARHRPSGSLSTAHRARIEIMPHQLEPALAILRGLGSRVLIADDVGLGKTIQAGLIVSELMAAGADRVLVLTPAGLREQWLAELRDRFGLDAAILDMREARTRAASLPVGLNPWLTVPLAIASIDYVKRPEVLPAARSCRWDVVVVDEAHSATPSSDRHHALNALCGRAPYVALLTATPHNGDRAAFESLCRIGQLQDEPRDHLLVFRRNRRDVGLTTTRRVHCLRVVSTSDERLMHQCLAQFVGSIRSEHDDSSVWLALATLHKRALSSAFSLRKSVVRRLSVLDGRTPDGPRQLALPMLTDEGDSDSADEAPEWESPALANAERERTLLVALAAAAERASARESKLIALSRLLRRLGASGEPAIVFTEYRDTLLHLRHVLVKALAHAWAPDGTPAILHGGLTRDERRAALEEFRSGRRPILLATDAGGQGLNLHQRCRVVINLELPWNPMKLEQRIGRVDRIGQQRTVHAFNLILRDSGEARVFERLKARIEHARQDIGVADPLSSQNDDSAGYRLVVGVNGEMASADTSRGSPVPCLRLIGEAGAERDRLLRARTMERRREASGGPSSIDSWLDLDTLVIRAKHPATRARIASRALVLFHSVVEDRCGRLLASEITPVEVAIAELLRRLPLRSIAAALLAALAGWQPADPRLEQYRAFSIERMARERAIAEAIRRDLHQPVQPGLFDRRGDYDARSLAIQEADERTSMVAKWFDAETARHRLALILIP